MSMRELVNATLQEGLVPPVVPEFPNITVGGAVQGMGGESGSFRYGGVHQLVNAAEYILGDGSVVEASPDTNSDLFYAANCSYGSMGVLTQVEMDLIPSQPYVELEYRPVGSFDEMIRVLKKATGADEALFVDGIMFAEDEGVVMVGSLTGQDDLPLKTFRKATDEWFYLHARSMMEEDGRAERVPIRDYLFRYDRGAFWTGKYVFERFGLPFNRLTRTLLDPFLHTAPMYHALHETDISHEYFIQDICVPVEEADEFIAWVNDSLNIYPLWFCPFKPDDRSFLSPAFMDTELVMNIGVWGQVPDNDGFYTYNEELEDRIIELGGRKWLYAHQYFSEEDFWSIYDSETYRKVRESYGADGVFPDVYEVTRVSERPEPSVRKAWWQVISAPFQV